MREDMAWWMSRVVSVLSDYKQQKKKKKNKILSYYKDLSWTYMYHLAEGRWVWTWQTPVSNKTGRYEFVWNVTFWSDNVSHEGCFKGEHRYCILGILCEVGSPRIKMDGNLWKLQKVLGLWSPRLASKLIEDIFLVTQKYEPECQTRVWRDKEWYCTTNVWWEWGWCCWLNPEFISGLLN